MGCKINYCLAAWSGKRGAINHTGGYLQQHLDQLNRLKHDLAQVTISHPFNPDETAEYTDYLSGLKTLDNGCPIEILDQPNLGRSYGHWSRCYEKYRDEFQYYIFMEDDYLPVLNHFDEILRDLFDQKDCGYLCSAVLDKPVIHAGISNGISSSEVLQVVFERFGCLPHDVETNYKRGQIDFSLGFTNCGFGIADYLDKYRALYYQHNQVLRWYGHQKEDLIVPIQYFRPEKKYQLKKVK